MRSGTGRDHPAAALIGFLLGGEAAVRPAATPGNLIVDGGERGTIIVPAKFVERLLENAVLVRDGSRLRLHGKVEQASRKLAASSRFADQHRQLEIRTIELPEGWSEATININESPLAQLSRRRTQSGDAFLTEAEFQAGERLRSDYTRGQIMPRLGANWEAGVSRGRRGAGGSVAELTEAALGARQRAEKAIVAVGPELAGVLVDVCCFLKGLETVESERRWPARSAKIVLKAALGALDRHYRPQTKTPQPSIIHWGTRDFRPSLTGGAC